MNPASVLRSAAAAMILALSAGCIYAPIDFGIGEIGKMQEVTLVESHVKQKILMLHIDGEINDQGTSSFFGSTEGTCAQVKDVLDLARDDEHVVAVLLRVNSPGGGVTASDIIYREILEWKRQTKKPVVALMMDTAASGGYYISMAADKVIAHPTCITGSIGVITMLPNVSGLADKLGVQVVTIKSGEHKDMGSMFRPSTDDDRKLFQSLIDQMYGRFVDVVTEGRHGLLKRERVKELADGRVYTAAEAKAAKLIDDVGYFDDALAAVKALAGVKEARVVAFERKGLGNGRRTIYSTSLADPIGASFLGRGQEGDRNLVKIDAGPVLPSGPVFKYLWMPNIR